MRTEIINHLMLTHEQGYMVGELNVTKIEWGLLNSNGVGVDTVRVFVNDSLESEYIFSRVFGVRFKVDQLPKILEIKGRH